VGNRVRSSVGWERISCHPGSAVALVSVEVSMERKTSVQAGVFTGALVQPLLLTIPQVMPCMRLGRNKEVEAYLQEQAWDFSKLVHKKW